MLIGHAGKKHLHDNDFSIQPVDKGTVFTASVHDGACSTSCVVNEHHVEDAMVRHCYFRQFQT